MNAGALKELCVIEQLNDVKNDFGQVVENYVAVATLRCLVQTPKGDDYTPIDSQRHKIVRIFRIRYLPGVDNTMYVSHRGTRYRIISTFDRDFEHREIMIYCEKVE